MTARPEPGTPRANAGEPAAPRQETRFAARVALGALIGLLLLALAGVLWLASDLILLVFAGVLLAVLLHGLGAPLADWLRLPTGVGIAAVGLALLVLFGLGAWSVGPLLADQGGELIASMTDTLARLQNWAMSIEEVEEAVDQSDAQEMVGMLPNPMQILGGATTLITSTLGGVGSLVLLIFFGIYFAADPDLYARGLVRLFAPARRARIDAVMQEMGIALRHWMVGQAATMLVLGVVSYVALRLLGVPFAFTLSVVSGLAAFLPYLGPIIAGALMLLVAFSESTTLALYVLAFYVALQFAESYLLTPLVQSHAIKLPPALVIAVQVLMGVLAGGLGLALATPLAAIGAVAVQRFYVEDVLGDRA